MPSVKHGEELRPRDLVGSFGIGFFSAFDLSGRIMLPELRRRRAPSSIADDRNALASDWGAIGRDTRRAIKFM